MTAVLSFIRTHLEACAWIFALLCVVVAIIGSNRSGRNEQARLDQAATIATARHLRDSITLADTLKLIPVRHENDSLRASNAKLLANSQSLTQLVNARRTSDSLVRSRMVLRGDTVTLKSDSGVQQITIPPVLAKQLAAERMVTDSLLSAMEHRHDADSALVAGKDSEITGLRTQIGLDSTVVLDYRKQLATADSATDAATKLARPRFTATQGAALGAIGTLGSLLILALVF